MPPLKVQAPRLTINYHRPPIPSITLRLTNQIIGIMYLSNHFGAQSSPATKAFISLQQYICRDRLEVRTLRCGRNNPGSNPGHGIIFFLLLH